MGAQGTTTVDFGAFPGSSDSSVAVTGQTGILSGSLVEAWMYPVATADHTADEHWVEGMVVSAGNIVAGTGFTIYARSSDDAVVDDESASPPQAAPLRYGLWTVAWVWN